MKSFLYSLVLLTTFGFSSSIAWDFFIAKDGGFRILTPGEMTEKVDVVDTKIGALTYHTFLYQPEAKDADNLVYMVSYCDYPEGAIHSDSTELISEFFTTTIETSVKSVKGELFYSSEVNYKDYPGRIWRVNYNDGLAVIKTKAFLVGRRYFSIQTVTLREKSLNPKADKFLDSFELL